MKSTSEMFMSMLPSFLKAAGFDPKAVEAEFSKVRGTVNMIGQAGISIFNGVCMANRRLARIERHLGLSDIEPVPEPMKAISHDDPKHDDGERGAVLALPPSAR